MITQYNTGLQGERTKMGQCLDIFTRVRNNTGQSPEPSEKANNIVTSTPILNQTYTISGNPNETELSNSYYVTALAMSPTSDSSMEQTLTQDMFKNLSGDRTGSAEQE